LAIHFILALQLGVLSAQRLCWHSANYLNVAANACPELMMSIEQRKQGRRVDMNMHIDAVVGSYSCNDGQLTVRLLHVWLLPFSVGRAHSVPFVSQTRA
jgi:hypothetical protein